MTTRQHLSSQPRKVTTCFVLDDCGDDSETFANMVDGEVSFSMKPTKQTSPTPIAFNPADTEEENILEIHTANYDDGPWSTKDEHKSDRNTRFKNGTYCGMLSGDALRNSPKQVVSTTEAGNASADICEFLSWTRKNNDVDATTPVSQRKTNDALKWAKTGLWQEFKKAPRPNDAQDSWHDSKTAVNVATGSRSMFLTTHEGDIRRRS